jgi:hypothetical protein
MQREVWDGSDEVAFASLDHPGYSLESDPVTFTGGWHSHRQVWEDDKPETKEETEASATTTLRPRYCWIKEEVMPVITKFDYTKMPIGRPPKILVLYGSLRPTSFSKKAAYEFARLLGMSMMM